MTEKSRYTDPKKEKKQKTLLLAGILSAALSMSGCTVGNTEVVLDAGSLTSFGGVFSINGEKCPEKEAKVYLANYKNLYGTSFGIDLETYDTGEVSLDDYARQVTLEELARIYSIDQMAKQQNMTLDEEETAAVRTAAETYYASLSEADLAFLEVTQEELEEYYAHYALAEKLYQEMFSETIEEISEDEARVMKVQAIFTSDSEKAAEAAEALKQGMDFEKAASAYSELSKTDVTVNRETYDDTINAVIFSMDNDEVSEAIETDEGTWFFKIINKYVQDLTEARRIELQEAEQTKAFREAYDAFREESMYTLNEAEWNRISLDEAEAVTTEDFFAVYDER